MVRKQPQGANSHHNKQTAEVFEPREQNVRESDFIRRVRNKKFIQFIQQSFIKRVSKDAPNKSKQRNDLDK